MTQPAGSAATAVVAAVEPDLAEHLIELLAAAGIVAVDRSQTDGTIAVVVRAADFQRATQTLQLVLPGTLSQPEPQEATGRLSDRLIRHSTMDRSDGTAGEPPALVDGRAVFDALGADRDDALYDPAQSDDFVPPEPPPIPRGDVVSRFAWLGAIGGPILMLVALLADLPPVLAACGLAAFVLGFAVLIARMPDRARQDDGWDDGAVL